MKTREEEIKQNAEAYADKKAETVANFQRNPIVEDFINGAQWADEHPKNPWISVKDRLPEDGQIIVLYITQTISGGGEKNVEHQMVVERYKGRFTCDRMEQQRMGGYMFDIVVKTTHWLPMPQLPKGGEV